MTQPKTEYEETGGLTSDEAERDFLEALAQDTDLHVSEVGRSARDRTIWECSIGNPEAQTMYIVASQHGSEPAGREAALIWIRDLAYSDDSDVLQFLENCRVVLVPNANPDGLNSGTRNNANGVDMNRDWYTLEQPETRAIAASINRAKPALLLDLHEWRNVDDFIFGYQGFSSGPPRHPAINPVRRDYIDSVVSDMDSAGYKPLRYYLGAERESASDQMMQMTTSSTPASGTLMNAAIRWNTIPFLTETKVYLDLSDRVEAQILFLELTRQWCMENRQRIIRAVNQANADDMAGETVAYIPSYSDDGNLGPWTPIDAPDYYTIPRGYEVPLDFLDMTGISVDSEGRISTHQRGRQFIAIFFDSSSYWKTPLRARRKDQAGGRAKVKMGGMKYLTHEAFYKKNGLKYRVKSFTKKQRGLRFSS